MNINKLILSAFNRALIEEDLDFFDFASLDALTASVNGAHTEGDTTINCDGGFTTGIDPVACVIDIDGHSQPYYISSVSLAGGLTKDLAINPPLQHDVADNSVITILPYYNVSDFVADISDKELTREANQNEFITDSPIDIELCNFDNDESSIFYDRLIHSTAWSTVSAIFTTYNSQELQDIKYASVSIRPTEDDEWQVFYVGRIVRDRLKIVDTYDEKSVKMLCESVFTGLSDVSLSEIDGIYNGHWYNYYEPDRPTLTVSGRYIDIIVKLFHAIGVPKKYLTISSTEKTAGLCKIGFDSDPEINTGEFIEVLRGDTSFDGRFRCEISGYDSGTWYVYYTFGTDTVALDSSNTTNGCIAHRVIFDPMEDYINDTYNDVSYGFDSAFFNVPKWKKKEVEYEAKAIEVMNEICNHASSFAFADFSDGKLYGFFRARKSTRPIKKVLGRDSFINKPVIGANWRFYSNKGVTTKSDIEYFNQEINSQNINYRKIGTICHEDEVASFPTVTEAIGNGSKSFGIYPTGVFEVGDYIQLQNQDQKYQIKSITVDSGLDIVVVEPPLFKSIKSQSFVSEYSTKTLDVRFSECFSILLKYPTIYYSEDTGKFVKLLNNGDSITDYTDVLIDQAVGAPASGGISHIDLLPYSGYSEINLGEMLVISFLSDDFDYVMKYRNALRAPFVYGSNEFFGITSQAIYYQVAYVNGDDDEKVSQDSTSLVFMAVRDNGDVKRSIVSMPNQGESPSADNAFQDSWYFNLVRIETSDFIDKLSPSAAAGYSLFMNSNHLNPDYDEKYYTAYLKAGTWKMVSSKIFGDSSVLDLFNSGLTSAVHNLNIVARESYSPMYYLRGNGRIYKSDDDNFLSGTDSTFTSIAGGGATSPAVGASCAASDLTFTPISVSEPGGLWACYNKYIVFGDATGDKIFILDEDAATVYCLISADSPVGIVAVDFTHVFDSDGVIKDINYIASKKQNDFFNEVRRTIEESDHEWNDLDNLSFTIGDRFGMNTEVCSNEDENDYCVFWVDKYRFKWVNHEFTIDWLEDTGVDVGIGAMTIGEDFEVA